LDDLVYTDTLTPFGAVEVVGADRTSDLTRFGVLMFQGVFFDLLLALSFPMVDLLHHMYISVCVIIPVFSEKVLLIQHPSNNLIQRLSRV